jgi:ABC-type nitrate/sulfonate/bicarbonate transport system substrate-binding protein
MVGKPIGCPSNSTICPLAASWFHKEGYGTLKFKYVPEADQFPLFRAGKVSSLVTYNLTQPLLESPGKRLNMVLFANYGMTHFYGNGIVLNSKWAARHATAAKAFVAATMNGFQYALTHPKAAVAIMTSEFPTLTASTALSQLRLEKGLLASAKAATMACIRNRFVASTVNFDIEGLKLPAADRTLPLTTDAYEPASCAS